MVSDTKSPVDWVPTKKPTELSRINIRPSSESINLHFEVDSQGYKYPINIRYHHWESANSQIRNKKGGIHHHKNLQPENNPLAFGEVQLHQH